MKSKKAKETIQSVRFTLTDPLKYTARKYVNTQLVTAGIASMAVHQAEQDAEERAKYALKYALKFMTTLTESQKDAIAMHFEDALNNL